MGNYTDIGRGFRGQVAKKMRNIPCTSIAMGAFISSINEVISKQKLDMPKAITGLIALVGESARQEFAARVQWAVQCRARWCLSLKPSGQAFSPNARQAAAKELSFIFKKRRLGLEGPSWI